MVAPQLWLVCLAHYCRLDESGSLPVIPLYLTHSLCCWPVRSCLPLSTSLQVRLDPRSMKDDESTLNCTQVFVVTACQPRALEVVIAGQSYLLGPGDHFFVPQGTYYRLVNHSPTTGADVAFIVIKPYEADAVPMAPADTSAGSGAGSGASAGGAAAAAHSPPGGSLGGTSGGAGGRR